MEVILLEKVENLGDLGEKVSVRPGYARNYLVPGGKAKPATPENIAEFEARRAELERMAAEGRADAEQRRERIEALGTVRVQANAGTEGKLFGSIGPADICAALEAQGVEVERREVRLPEGPIREVGEYTIELHLHTDVNASLVIEVVPER